MPHNIVTKTPENTVNVEQENNSKALTSADVLVMPAQSSQERLALGFRNSPIIGTTPTLTVLSAQNSFLKMMRPWNESGEVVEGDLNKIQAYYNTSQKNILDLSYWRAKTGAPNIKPGIQLVATTGETPEAVVSPHMPNILPPDIETGDMPLGADGNVIGVVKSPTLEAPLQNTVPGSGERAYLRNPNIESARNQSAWANFSMFTDDEAAAADYTKPLPSAFGGGEPQQQPPSPVASAFDDQPLIPDPPPEGMGSGPDGSPIPPTPGV